MKNGKCFATKKYFVSKWTSTHQGFFFNLNLEFGGFSPKHLEKIVKFTIEKENFPKKFQFVETKSTCTYYQTIHTLLLYCHQIFPKKEIFLNSELMESNLMSILNYQNFWLLVISWLVPWSNMVMSWRHYNPLSLVIIWSQKKILLTKENFYINVNLVSQQLFNIPLQVLLSKQK